MKLAAAAKAKALAETVSAKVLEPAAILSEVAPIAQPLSLV